MKKLFPLLFVLLGAGCEILEEDLSDGTVQILSPVPGATVPAGSVAFCWVATRHAAGYEFTVATPAFPTACRIVADTTILADSLVRHYGCCVELAPGAYEWRVRAYNTTSMTRMETHALTVRVAEPAPDASDPAGPGAPQTPENPEL